MTLQITFLGTGGAFTDFRENYHNNAAVHIGEEQVALIDCGGTAVQSLKEIGIRAWSVPYVIVTHLHGDHVGGIEQLAWERFYTGKNGPGFQKTHLIATSEIQGDLRDVLTPCVDEYTQSDGVSRSGGFDALFNLKYVISDVTVGDVQFILHRVPHVVDSGVDKPCYGVLIRERDTSSGGFFFTSDTTFRPQIGEMYPDVGVIFHDCTFSPKYTGTVHTHYEDLLTLPDDVRNRIVLMHHTKVPEHIDIRKDGFLYAAHRHDTFTLEGEILKVAGPVKGATFRRTEGRWVQHSFLRMM